MLSLHGERNGRFDMYEELNDRERIGRCMFELRKSRGMSLRKLSELSGVSFANISKIENGKYNVSIDILSKIASALECEIEIIKKVE